MPSKTSIRVNPCSGFESFCPPTGGGGTPALGTATCASRTGSGNLRGWSKFQNPNSGDWNRRKAKRGTWTPGLASPRLNEIFYDGPTNCSGAVLVEHTRTAVENVAEYNVSTNAIDTYLRRSDDYDPCNVGNNDTDFDPSLAGSDLSGLVALMNIGSRGLPTVTNPTDWTVRAAYGVQSDVCQSVGGTGGECDPDPAGITCRQVFGHAAHNNELVLDDFDTISAALARAAVSAGALCKTTAGTIDSVSAASAGGVAFSSTTGVEVTQPIIGLTIGETYEFDIILKRYTAGGGAFVDEISVTVEFEATGTTENYQYEVPVNTDFDYEFDHSENLVLIP